MLDQNDTTYFNVKGIQINDPSINHDAVTIYGMFVILEIAPELSLI